MLSASASRPSATSPPADDHDIRAKFWTTLLLLIFVTSLNNESHATLTQPATKKESHHIQAPGTDDSLVVNAFAAILIREHEIIAVAGIASSSGPPSASPLPPDEALLAQNRFKQVNFTGFAILANPDTQDTYFKRV